MDQKKNTSEEGKSGVLDTSVERVTAQMMTAIVDTARVGMSTIENINNKYFKNQKYDEVALVEEKKDVIKIMLPGIRDLTISLFFQQIYLAALYKEMADIGEVVDFVHQEAKSMTKEVAAMFASEK